MSPRAGYSDILYIGRLCSFFWGFIILNFNIFGGFQKNEYFLGSSQNWTILRVISMHFRVFSQGQVTEWGYFGGLLKFFKGA